MYLKQEGHMPSLSDFVEDLDAFSLQAFHVILITSLEKLNRLHRQKLNTINYPDKNPQDDHVVLVQGKA